jgi:hypothetical protein
VTTESAALRAARGRLVRDEVTGQVGRLMYVGDWEDPSTRKSYRLAFIRPEHGGREWTTAPDKVTVLTGAGSGTPGGRASTVCAHPDTEQRGGKTYCESCRKQLYL